MIYGSDYITVFPTVNSRDNGKLTLEENMSNIVSRITKRSFITNPDSFNITGNGQNVTVSSGSCNINGYDINTTQSMTFAINSISDSFETNPDNFIYDKYNDFQTSELCIGLVLIRAQSGRLQGDRPTTGDESQSYEYYGVELRLGSSLLDNSIPDKDKLIIGCVRCSGSSGSWTIINVYNDPNKVLVINGDTIYVDGTNLINYITDKYVAKEGNNFEDSNLVKHVSDIYGSLMFRDSKTSNDYNIEIGNNGSKSKIELKDNTNTSVDGIKMESGNNSDNISMGNVKRTVSSNNVNKEILESTEANTDVESDIHGSVKSSKQALFNYNGSLKYDFRDDELVVYFGEDTELNDSQVAITCDDSKATFKFGNNSPVFMDYDTTDLDLSFNDINGNLGVLTFCDGQCVDEALGDYNHSDPDDPTSDAYDMTYDYEDDNIPKVTQEIKPFNESIHRVFWYSQDNVPYNMLKFNKLKNQISGTKHIITSRPCNYALTTGDIIDELGIEPAITRVNAGGSGTGQAIMFGAYINETGEIVPSAGYGDWYYDNTGGHIQSPEAGHNYITYYYHDGTSVSSYDYIVKCYRIPEGTDNMFVFNYAQEILNETVSFSDLNGVKSAINFSEDKLNGYFCRKCNDGETPTVTFAGINFVILGDILDYANLSSIDRVTNIPQGATNFLLSIPRFSQSAAIGNNVNTMFEVTDSVKTPSDNNPSSYINCTIHGVQSSGHKSVNIYINVTDNEITQDMIEDDGTIVHGSVYQLGLSCRLLSSDYNLKISGEYLTAADYKSFRIHGYYSGYTADAAYNEETPPAVVEDNFRYRRLIYNLGFGLCRPIINKVTIDNKQFYRVTCIHPDTGEQVIIKLSVIYTWFGNELTDTQSAGISSYNATTAFYIDNFQNPTEFFCENDYEDNSSVTCSGFYKNNGTGLRRQNYAESNYSRFWYMKNLVVTNTAGINFNLGQNNLNFNIDSYFNALTHFNKLISGESEETSSVLCEDYFNLIFGDTLIKIDEYGFKFLKDPDIVEDANDTVINRTFNTATNEDWLNISSNLNVSGDIIGTRVFNAVYNDIAEFYKKDNIDEIIEPGDVIELNPKTGNFRKCIQYGSSLVVGVCSDSFGHILGGDKNKSIEQNMKEYIPIGLSGRVKAKTNDISIIPGDLVVSGINGMVRKCPSYMPGCIIGKSLGYPENGKVLIQIMLS